MVSWRRSGGNLLRRDLSIIEVRGVIITPQTHWNCRDVTYAKRLIYAIRTDITCDEMADEKSAEESRVIASKVSGRGAPGEEPPIPRGMPRGEKKAVSSESND